MTGEPLKVGVLVSQTGVTSVIERTQLAATQLAIEEVNSAGGVRGRLLQMVAYDPASDPALYRNYARRLIEEDGVSIVFGCYMSSARRALLPIIERNNALLCYPTFYEGFEYSENVLYFGSVPNQTNRALADLVMGRFGERAVLIGSDYLFPRESNRLMHNILARRGGSVLGEIYLPLNAPAGEFEVAIASAQAAAPDFIFSTVVGSDIPKLYRAFRSRGLDPAKMPIASVTATETELASLPEGMAAGHITAAPYFASLPSAENRRFVQKFRERFGTDKMANMCAEASYISVHLTAQGIRIAGADDPRALARALHGVSFEAPQGPVKVDAENNHCYLFSRIGQMRDDGQFDIIWESAESTKPDPYFFESKAAVDRGNAASPAAIPLLSSEIGA
jgi:branched-chain amino acid transport system substrate-binding protein